MQGVVAEFSSSVLDHLDGHVGISGQHGQSVQVAEQPETAGPLFREERLTQLPRLFLQLRAVPTEERAKLVDRLSGEVADDLRPFADLGVLGVLAGEVVTRGGQFLVDVQRPCFPLTRTAAA